MIRTSETDPIRVAEVDVGIGQGKIGVTFAPGKNDGRSLAVPGRETSTRISTPSPPGARRPSSLCLNRKSCGGSRSRGSAPKSSAAGWSGCTCRSPTSARRDAAFEAKWPEVSRSLRSRLDAGENILVHCRGGLGRAGMIAARLAGRDRRVESRSRDRARTRRSTGSDRDRRTRAMGADGPATVSSC